jgi:hypothetical protein
VTETSDLRPPSGVTVDLSAVLVAVVDSLPCVLTLAPRATEQGREAWAGSGGALPRGPLDLASDRTLERGLRRWVSEQTGAELGYVEQLYTFGDRGRDPRERQGGPRVVSVAYLGLVRAEEATTAGARWQPWYELLPWEDHRDGEPQILDRDIRPRLLERAQHAPDDQGRTHRERVDLAFACGGVEWDDERVLDRYELLYGAGLVYEAHRDAALPDVPTESEDDFVPGRPMALDHRRIAATALARLRGKLKYRPVVFELLPEEFTLLELQRVVEALAGVGLHKQNFRRLVERGGLVEGTGRSAPQARGRPAELFRFRREVTRERLEPGVFPRSRSST